MATEIEIKDLLTGLGFTQEFARDVPVGVPVSRSEIERYPLIATSKWISKDKNVEVKVWDDFAVVRSKHPHNCFYETLPFDNAIELIKKTV